MRSSLTVFTGAAGTGKTSRILAEPRYEAIATYTNAVAENAARRGGSAVKARTIYSLLWPHLRTRRALERPRSAQEAAYFTRPAEDAGDPILDQFAADAPSEQPRTEAAAMARALHGWESGAPPFDLAECRRRMGSSLPTDGPLAFALTLAEFLADVESDPTWEPPYGLVAGDEWQDFSALEARATLTLADEVHGYGDPCQAIFSTSKGNEPGALPYGWRVPGRKERALTGGHRCGDPLASLAARVIGDWWEMDPRAFRAIHDTEVIPWDAAAPPERGLVMGWRRQEEVSDTFRAWDLKQKFIRMGERADPDGDLVLATIHNAKGYESDDCYLLPWPRALMRGLARGEVEARKLLYTALTRARKRVFVPREILGAVELWS